MSLAKLSPLFKGLALLVPLIAVLGSSGEASARICPEPWKGASGDDCVLEAQTLPLVVTRGGVRKSVTARIRSGYLRENQEVPFRGNVIYFEGLADSMLNHMPLFSKLTAAGFRVIAFDYMGQGGSDGDMNDTRIHQIARIGDVAWARHGRDLSRQPKKTIIGWSTGGLAAYTEAIVNPAGVEKIVLIAPGIVPNLKVGEQHAMDFEFNRITLATLTTADYSRGLANPHVDPIDPESPLDVFWGFSKNLVFTAMAMRHRTFPSSVRGFVLLSGENDTYVDAKKTLKVLRKKVPTFGTSFSAKVYPTALHEIDNESEPTASTAHADIVGFLTGVRQERAKW